MGEDYVLLPNPWMDICSLRVEESIVTCHENPWDFELLPFHPPESLQERTGINKRHTLKGQDFIRVQCVYCCPYCRENDLFRLLQMGSKPTII